MKKATPIGTAHRMRSIGIYLVSDSHGNLEKELQDCIEDEESRKYFIRDKRGRLTGVIFAPHPDRMPYPRPGPPRGRDLAHQPFLTNVNCRNGAPIEAARSRVGKHMVLPRRMGIFTDTGVGIGRYCGSRFVYAEDVLSSS